MLPAGAQLKRSRGRAKKVKVQSRDPPPEPDRSLFSGNRVVAVQLDGVFAFWSTPAITIPDDDSAGFLDFPMRPGVRNALITRPQGVGRDGSDSSGVGGVSRRANGSRVGENVARPNTQREQARLLNRKSEASWRLQSSAGWRPGGDARGQ